MARRHRLAADSRPGRSVSAAWLKAACIGARPWFVATLAAAIVVLAAHPAFAARRAAQPGREAASVSPIQSPSASCSPSRPHAPGTSVESISTTFGPRSYRLHVPASYTGTSAVPLVFNWHGAASNAADEEAYTRYSTKADANNFIVVYPQGVITTQFNFTHFNAWLAPGPDEPDDVGFAGAMLDELESGLCIDASRVFSTGFSNGGLMSVRLACSLSSRIAAIAPVAGAYYPPAADGLNLSETCPDTRSVPIVAFHGTADTTVPYNGGASDFPYVSLTFRLPIDTPSALDEDVMSDWAAHNGCAGTRQESTVSSEVELIQYPSCSDGAEVELYAVTGGGHTWPDAIIDVPELGYTTHQVSATNLGWSFFVAHPMPATAPSVGGVAEVPKLAAGPAPGSTRGRAFAFGVSGALAALAALAGITVVGVAARHVRPRR